MTRFLRLHRPPRQLRASASPLGPRFRAPDSAGSFCARWQAAHRQRYLPGDAPAREWTSGRRSAVPSSIVRLYSPLQWVRSAWGATSHDRFDAPLPGWGIAAQGCREVDMMIGSGLDKRPVGLREEPVVSLVLANRRARSPVALARASHGAPGTATDPAKLCIIAAAQPWPERTHRMRPDSSSTPTR